MVKETYIKEAHEIELSGQPLGGGEKNTSVIDCDCDAVLAAFDEWLEGTTVRGANDPLPAPMPPHPDLLERVRRGEITLPDFVTNPGLRQQMGIDQPQELALAPQATWNALALLVEFTDNPSQVGAAYFDSLLFGGVTGTLDDYYSAVSYGTLNIVTVNLPSSIGWCTMPQTYAYYVAGNYLWDLEHKTDQGDTGDPYPGSTNNRSFTFTSVPNSSSYTSSADTTVGVTNISNSGSTMTADLYVAPSGSNSRPRSPACRTCSSIIPQSCPFRSICGPMPLTPKPPTVG